jgi:hypothetical protein
MTIYTWVYHSRNQELTLAKMYNVEKATTAIYAVLKLDAGIMAAIT